MLSSTVVALYVLLVCMVFLCIVIQAIFKQEKSSFTSIVQGSMRFNLYNLLATVAVFYGDDALTTMAVIIGFYIPLINIICVIMFAVYLKSTAFSLIKTIISLIKNPLLISSLIGITLGIFKIRLPYTVFEFTRILGNAALPMGLLPIGYALRFLVIKNDFLRISQASALKLFVMPYMAFFLSIAFNLEPLIKNILILFAAQPTAISSYILAKQLGGNYKLMASIIYTQTIISFITIPIIVRFFEYR